MKHNLRFFIFSGNVPFLKYSMFYFPNPQENFEICDDKININTQGRVNFRKHPLKYHIILPF